MYHWQHINGSHIPRYVLPVLGSEFAQLREEKDFLRVLLFPRGERAPVDRLSRTPAEKTKTWKQNFALLHLLLCERVPKQH